MYVTIFATLILMPLLVCIAGALLSLDSVGPMVPITFVINHIALPICIFFILKRHSRVHVVIRIIFGILAGLFLAELTVASYMVLTPWFGVDNFEWL